MKTVFQVTLYGALHEDNNGFIWIGTQGGGLDKFDPETEYFIHYVNDPANTTSISANDIRAISQDSSGTLMDWNFRRRIK